MKTKLLALSLLVLTPFALQADLTIPATGTVTVDFESFTGAGLDTGGGPGLLDSDTFVVLGLSDGDTGFSGTYTTGDYARGTDADGATTGGLYAWQTGGDIALGFQPTGSDASPGTILVRLANGTANPITSIDVSYGFTYYNDQGRDNTWALGHADNDSGTLTTVNSDITPAAADGVPAWVTANRTETISGINIPGFSQYYIGFVTDTGPNGSGSQDQLGITYLTVGITGIPEPASATLAIFGLGLLVATRRLRK